MWAAPPRVCVCRRATLSHRPQGLGTRHIPHLPGQHTTADANPPTTQTVHAYSQPRSSGRPEAPCPQLAGLPTGAGWNRKLPCPDRRSASASLAQAQWSSDGVVGGEKEEAEGRGRSQKMAEAGVSWGTPATRQ